MPPKVSRRTPARQPCSAGPPAAAGCRAARRSSRVGSGCADPGACTGRAGAARRSRSCPAAVSRSPRRRRPARGGRRCRRSRRRSESRAARCGRRRRESRPTGRRDRAGRAGPFAGRLDAAVAPTTAVGCGARVRFGPRPGERRLARPRPRALPSPDRTRSAGESLAVSDVSPGSSLERPGASSTRPSGWISSDHTPSGSRTCTGTGRPDGPGQLGDAARDRGAGLGEVRHAHALDDAVDRDLAGPVLAHLGADVGQSGRRRRRVLPVGAVTHGQSWSRCPSLPVVRPRNYAAQGIRASSNRRPAR